MNVLPVIFACHAKFYCFSMSEHQKLFDWPGDLEVEDFLIENKSLEMSCRDGGFVLSYPEC